MARQTDRYDRNVAKRESGAEISHQIEEQGQERLANTAAVINDELSMLPNEYVYRPPDDPDSLVELGDEFDEFDLDAPPPDPEGDNWL